MSIRKFELLLSMGGLFGVSIYRAVGETAHGYRNERIDLDALPWRWYVHVKTHVCIRATRLNEPVRVLASPLGKGTSAYDVPHTMMLVHDLGRVWAMAPADFQAEYVSAELLVQAVPSGGSAKTIETTSCGDCPFCVRREEFHGGDSCAIDPGPPPRHRGQWQGIEVSVRSVPAGCPLRHEVVLVKLDKLKARLKTPKRPKKTD